ncbi:MAG: hypothetical protein ABI462_04285 [Ignavibacteria bacterium]
MIKDAGGPYFLNYYDPSYVYLINSLNLMQLSSVGHYDHPGTTVQVLGAIILKLKFLSVNSNEEIIRIVFSDPEKYLEFINRCFVLLNSLTLFLLGIFIFKLTKNIYMGLLLQLSPFVSLQILYGLVLVAPENIIIFSSILLIGVLFYFIYKVDPENPSLSFIIICGIICGFGTVTKLTFIPMWLIPFILIKKIKNKVLFVLSGVITFCFLFLPAISNYKNFIGWIQNIVFSSKVHGTYGQTFKISLYLENIISVFKQDKVLLIVYIFMLINIIMIFANRKTNPENLQLKKSYKVQIAIFIGITAQILLIAKNYVLFTQYYLIPSFVLLVSGLCVSVSILYDVIKKYFRRITLNQIYIFFTLLITVFAFELIISTYKEAVVYRDEAYKVRNMIKNDYKNDLVIPSLMTANDDCALVYMVFNNYGGGNNKKYTDLLADMLNTEIYYYSIRDSFFTVPGNINIEKKIREHKKVIVQLHNGSPPLEKFTAVLKKNYNIESTNYKEIMTNQNGESIYEIEIK